MCISSPPLAGPSGPSGLPLAAELEAVPAKVVGPPGAALGLVELVALAEAAGALACGEGGLDGQRVKGVAINPRLTLMCQS
jgi:hypothetical protein